MRANLLTSLVLLLCLDVAFGFGVNYWTLKKSIKKNTISRHIKKHSSHHKPDGQALNVDSRVLIQPLDHFDPQIKVSYGQRYWVNSDFWKSPDGPVFLYIGGEGSLHSYYAERGAYVKFAQKYGALIFAVEHRFYGQSMNDDGLKLENLKYLSSQQALADLANFHLHISKQYNLTEKNRWIAFGGSYPGALSAWIRIKYPHLIYASIASSAPVRAEVNFEGYNDVVANSLSTTIVGGSGKCAATVRLAFQAVDQLISQDNLTQLVHDFQSCKPLESDLDIVQLVSNLADLFMGTVQYNNEDPEGLNVERVCSIMTKEQDPYQNLVSLNKEFLRLSHQNCSDNSWQNFLKFLSDDVLVRTADMDTRQWIYQTCSQFGYYQTCDDSECLFSRYMTLPPNLDICRIIFNISDKDVYDRVDFTNSYYGSDHPHGSRILFVNGLIDLWHALSVLRNLTQTELSIVIPGTAHCADMRDDSASDPPALTAARMKISQQIGMWLSEPEESGRPQMKPVHRSRNVFSAIKL